MSILTSRTRLSELVGKSFDGERDTYEVFGYTRHLTVFDFFAMYLRNEIAHRIIKAFPQATWRDAPDVTDNTEDSAFDKAWQRLWRKFNLGAMFERADRLSSIGSFGLLFVGINDGKEPDQPLTEGNYSLQFLTPYGQNNVQVRRFENDPKSPRFGKPLEYTIQSGSTLGQSQARHKTLTAHHTRVIHIAELLDEDDVYGVPRLMPIYNRLVDLEKVVGGSSESYWLTANRGLALLAKEDAQLTDEAKESAKEQAEEYQHQLRRILTLQGMEVQNLGSETPDPSGNVDVLLNEIAGGTGIPKRILTGTEAGELASTQDENNWNSRIDERKRHHSAPNMIMPFIDMMIQTGNLPEPQGEVDIIWDEATPLSETERSEIANNKIQSLMNYVRAPGAEELVTREEFREMIGLSPEPEGGFEDDDELDTDDPETTIDSILNPR